MKKKKIKKLQREIKEKTKVKFDELLDQIKNEYLTKVENIVIEYDWKEIPKEVDKNDVIYRAHTQNKGHHSIQKISYRKRILLGEYGKRYKRIYF